jgi:EamA domain-containing membrane protein RarD
MEYFIALYHITTICLCVFVAWDMSKDMDDQDSAKILLLMAVVAVIGAVSLFMFFTGASW